MFCPLLSADLSVDSPLMFPGCERCAPILHPGCCAKLCVFRSFRILPHKSASLLPLLWEQLFSAFPSIRSLVSGNGSLRLGNNRGLLGTKTKYASPLYSQVVLLEAEPKDRLWDGSFRKSQSIDCGAQALCIEFGCLNFITVGFW